MLGKFEFTPKSAEVPVKKGCAKFTCVFPLDVIVAEFCSILL